MCPFEGNTPRMTEGTQPPFAGGMTPLGIPSGFAKDGSDRSEMGSYHPERVTMGDFSAWNHTGRRGWGTPWSCHLHLSRPSSVLCCQELQPRRSQ